MTTRFSVMALALLLAPVAAQAEWVYGWGVYYPDGYHPNKDEIEPMAVSVKSGETADFTANLPQGHKVTGWYADFKTNPIMLGTPAITNETDSTAFSWVSNGTNAYIAARFAYITYRLRLTDLNWSHDYLYTNVVRLSGCERTGASFVCWTNDVGKAFESDTPYTAGPDGFDVQNRDDRGIVELSAKWDMHHYRMEYDLAGGSFADPAQNSVEYDQPFLVQMPRRTGYQFTGWKVVAGLSDGAYCGSDSSTVTPISSADMPCCTTNSAGGIWFRNLNPTNDATVRIQANWEPRSYTIMFWDFGGETDASSAGKVSDVLVVSYGERMPALKNLPSWGGYSFGGYFSGKDGKGVKWWNADGTPAIEAWNVPADADAYAYKVANPTRMVHFDANGGQLPGDADVEFKTNETCDPLKLKNPTWPDGWMDFAGWLDVTNGLVTTNSYILPGAGAVNLRAAWTPAAYSVRFEGNGASEGTMADQDFRYFEGQTLRLNAFRKGGYAFTGWATSATSAEIAYTDGQLVTNVLKDASLKVLTLHAIWKPVDYTVQFEANGGSGEMADQPFAYDAPQALAENQYVRKDWFFAGWTNEAAGTAYSNREDVSNLTARAGGDVVLKAVWTNSVSDLSKALGCENLNFTTNNANQITRTNQWVICEGGGVRQTYSDLNRQLYLKADIQKEGRLEIKWKSSDSNFGLSLSIVDQNKTVGNKYTNLSYKSSGGEYATFTTNVTQELFNEYGKPVAIWIAAVQVGTVKPHPQSYCDIQTITWTPDNVMVEVPTARKGLVYDGTCQTGVVATDDRYALEGNEETKAGTYTATATLAQPDDTWSDGSRDPTNITWSIAKAKFDLSDLAFPSVVATYDGQPHAIAVQGTLPAGVKVRYEGETSRTEVGTSAATAVFEVEDDYTNNYSAVDLRLSASVVIREPEQKYQEVINPPPDPGDDEEEIPLPQVRTGLVYDGTCQTGVIASAHCELTGIAVATNAGTYEVIASLRPGYAWLGGSLCATNLTWSIARGRVDLSGVRFDDVQYAYDGQPHSIAVAGTVPDGVALTYEGETTRTEIGTNTVVAKFAVIDTLNWEALNVALTAKLAIVSAPVPPPVPPDPPVPGGAGGSLYPDAASMGVFTGEYAATYNGWLSDPVRSNIVAALTVKTQAARRDGTCKATVYVTPLGGRKETYKNDEFSTSGNSVVDKYGIAYGALGLSGTITGEMPNYRGLTVQAAKDFSKAKDRDENDLVKKIPEGCYTLVLETASGYDALSATVAKKTGKTKISGTLDDGTKISASAQGLIGATWFAVPVVVANKKTADGQKQSFGFVLWVDEIDKGKVQVLNVGGDRWPEGRAEAQQLVDPSGRHVFRFDLPGGDPYPDYFREVDGYLVAPDYCPYEINGKKWDAGKTVGSVKLNKDTGLPYVQYREGQEPNNLPKLKLTYAPKTGLVTGSFDLFYLLNGKLKKDTAKITGVAFNGELLGNATIKKKPSFRVWSEKLR